MEDIRAKRKTYKRRTGRNIANFQEAVKGQERKICFFFDRQLNVFFLCVYAKLCILLRSRRKGARSAVRDFPMKGRAKEQKGDHGAPGAKRRHHFRGFTKKVIPLATPL